MRILHGDSLTVLRALPDASVHCCITSPPYYGLRDYGTATWEGGDPDCDHIDPQGPVNAPSTSSTLTTNNGRGPLPGDKYQSDRKAQYRGVCRKCGARRIDQQIGLEAAPAEYIARLVDVFHEVRRVLRDDGTLWVNIGDSYASGGNGGHQKGEYFHGHTRRGGDFAGHPKKAPEGLKPKDLIGIPWMLAFALRDDGWYLRQDIIWHKSNPMPESVKDRCTKAHEYVFMLSKSARYWCDMDAVAEPATYAGKVVTLGEKSLSKGQANGANVAASGNGRASEVTVKDTRNLRSVWTLATLPTPEAHFATFPIELPETCLRAGCPEGGTVLDPFCGAGTTGLACLKNGREFIGIELNPKYAEITNARVQKYYPLFAGDAA